MKAVVAAFNQEKALVGAFSVITNLRMELFEALVDSNILHLVLPAVPGLAALLLVHAVPHQGVVAVHQRVVLPHLLVRDRAVLRVGLVAHLADNNC